MNHLQNAIRKTSRLDRYTWYGYLIPKEVLALWDIECEIDLRYVELAIERKRGGEGGGLWAYFKPSEEYLQRKHGVSKPDDVYVPY